MKSQPQPTPRRKWHPQRWLLLLAASLLAYAGWSQYAYRSALKEAKALGWEMDYTDPVQEIRQNWKNTFRKGTWLDRVAYIGIFGGEEFERHLAIVQRLNPKELAILGTTALRDLSALKGLTRLEILTITGGSKLTNVDMLKNLPALKWVELNNCTALTNVDALKTLTALPTLRFTGSHGLTKESIEALKAALPNTEIRIDITPVPKPPSF